MQSSTIAYDAYGNQLAATGNVYNPLRYAGEYQDSQTGFYYLRARYYDPATAQFLTRDPLVAATEQAYTYANGSPLNFIDPSGQGPEILLLVVACPECAAVGAAGLLALWLIWNLQHNQQLQACFIQVGNQIGSNTWWSQTDDERALRELVDEVTNDGRKPLSREDAETILDWGDEIKYPGIRAKPGDVASPSNWKHHPDQPPHIHVPSAGRGGHVQVEPGVRPR